MRERMRAVLRLSCDQRMVAGVGGAVAHFAGRAGLEDDASVSLVAALEDLCLQALRALDAGADTVDVDIADFEDRLEIVVQHRNLNHVYPSASAEAASHSAKHAHARLRATVDQVESVAHNGSVRHTMIKYVRSRNGAC